MGRPDLVIFDLDFTLWDCGGTWCDCTRPPYRRVGGRIYDEMRNIRDAKPLGVRGIYVDRGLDWDLFNSALC